jgi:hypothetical protein
MRTHTKRKQTYNVEGEHVFTAFIARVLSTTHQTGHSAWGCWYFCEESEDAVLGYWWGLFRGNVPAHARTEAESEVAKLKP